MLKDYIKHNKTAVHVRNKSDKDR